MFKRSRLDKVLKQLKKSRSYFKGELNNIVFLDFDGVLNLDITNYTGGFKVKEPIENLNKFCLEEERNAYEIFDAKEDNCIKVILN